MTRMSAESRREELVAAAIRVMTRDGVAAATTRAIATEADMRLGFLHYCFRSKEELLLQVITALNRGNVKASMQVEHGHRLGDTLRAGARAYWAGVEREPDLHQLTYELTQYSLRRPELAAVARAQYEQYLETARDFLVTAAESTHMEWSVPVTSLARFTHTVLDGATLTWIVDRDSEAALTVLDTAADQVARQAKRARRR
jgi:AcrR family transcriptional regulator